MHVYIFFNICICVLFAYLFDASGRRVFQSEQRAPSGLFLGRSEGAAGLASAKRAPEMAPGMLLYPYVMNQKLGAALTLELDSTDLISC